MLNYQRVYPGFKSQSKRAATAATQREKPQIEAVLKGVSPL